MSTVNHVSSATTAQAISAATNQSADKSTTTTSDVSTNEFLKLLVTQLQNQDPMDPMDNSQFLTQLASFSSMEQLISINEGVSALADAYGADASTKDTSTKDTSE
jgi:flagellar basal-body rod modification protein FlgD